MTAVAKSLIFAEAVSWQEAKLPVRRCIKVECNGLSDVTVTLYERVFQHEMAAGGGSRETVILFDGAAPVLLTSEVIRARFGDPFGEGK